MMWHTPLGLPVVQPYRRKDKQHVRTLLQVGGAWLQGCCCSFGLLSAPGVGEEEKRPAIAGCSLHPDLSAQTCRLTLLLLLNSF